MKRYIPVLFFCFFTSHLFSQADRSEDFYFSSMEEEVLSLLEEARELGDENPAEKLQLAMDAYEISVTESFLQLQVDSQTLMGIAYFQLQEIEKSLQSLNQSLLMAEGINYIDGSWQSFYMLGLVHNFLGDSEKSISFFENADQLILDENDLKHIYVLRELAIVYQYERMFELAISRAENALLMAGNLEDENSIIELSHLLGEIEFQAGNIRTANNLFSDIIARTSVTGEHQLIRASAHSFMGKCYALLGDYHMALANAQDALLLSVKNGEDEGRLDAYDSLAFTYQHMDDFERAYINLQLYFKQKELLEQDKNTGNLDKIKAYYGTFEKEREIDQQQVLIESQNRLILLGALMIALLAVMILIFFLLYKKNSRIADRLSHDLKREMVLSKTDPVTGLPNRKEIEDLIQKSINSWKKDPRSFSILLISFEEYRKVDTQWGEGAGEKLQKFIGKLLETELKGQDTIAVWKPFLFMILLPETDRESLQSVRHKINMRFSREKYNYDVGEISLEFHMGSSTYSGDESRSACVDRCKRELEEARD